ncbi:MAG: molybdenum cofactor biosynthesis protein MoaE [Dehalococcoidales bacterium]|nr:molybdenum cofactor biosynthesis protein MoaE [Dehalococcoidales bacterium]
MIHVTDKPLSPEDAVARAKTPDSGCVATYVGLIRDNSRGKSVYSIEYTDTDGKAAEKLGEIAAEIRRKYPVNSVVIYHRIGRLEVGDINLVVAVAAAHRSEGLAAVAYAVDLFKEKLPTSKKETYLDGTVWEGH